MKPSEWDPAWGTDYDGADCQVCEPAEEYTDRVAGYAEQDADSAAIDAAIEGLA